MCYGNHPKVTKSMMKETGGRKGKAHIFPSHNLSTAATKYVFNRVRSRKHQSLYLSPKCNIHPIKGQKLKNKDIRNSESRRWLYGCFMVRKGANCANCKPEENLSQYLISITNTMFQPIFPNH
jgi:hypothetical protein